MTARQPRCRWCVSRRAGQSLKYDDEWAAWRAENDCDMCLPGVFSSLEAGLAAVLRDGGSELSDHRGLIEEAREKHKAFKHQPSGREYCLLCQDRGPCITARLAEALEQHAQEYAEFREHSATSHCVMEELVEAAERRAAELQAQLDLATGKLEKIELAMTGRGGDVWP